MSQIVKPLLPENERKGLSTRFFNFLRRIAEQTVQSVNAGLLNELDQGYREIAAHEAKMRQKYPDAYARADREVRRRYIHLDTMNG